MGGGSAASLYEPYNEHDHIAMWFAAVSGLHALAATTPAAAAPVTRGAESIDDKVPIWRGGAESLEAERGLVSAGPSVRGAR